MFRLVFAVVSFCALADACAPGSMVPAPDGCNRCICGPDGRVSSMCTKMACRGKRDDGQPCEPGAHWIEDCDACVCYAGGVKRCWRILCPEKRQVRRLFSLLKFRHGRAGAEVRGLTRRSSVCLRKKCRPAIFKNGFSIISYFALS